MFVEFRPSRWWKFRVVLATDIIISLIVSNPPFTVMRVSRNPHNQIFIIFVFIQIGPGPLEKRAPSAMWAARARWPDCPPSRLIFSPPPVSLPFINVKRPNGVMLQLWLWYQDLNKNGSNESSNVFRTHAFHTMICAKIGSNGVRIEFENESKTQFGTRTNLFWWS